MAKPTTASYFSFPFSEQTGPGDERPNVKAEAKRLKRACTAVCAAVAAISTSRKIIAMADEFRLLVWRDDGLGMPPAPVSGLAGQMDLAATELHKNAQRETPLPHRQALQYPALAPVLRAVAKSHKPGDAVPTYHDERGAYPIPLLPLSDFAEPVTRKLLDRKLCLVVTGIRHYPKNGWRLILGTEGIEVCPDPSTMSTLFALPIGSLHGDITYQGTIRRDIEGNWCTIPGGTITEQTLLPA